MANTELDLAIERMNKSFDTAFEAIIASVIKMTEAKVAGLIYQLSPEGQAHAAWLANRNKL